MSSLSLISVWGSTNENLYHINLYHSCYIVFQYVMIKIIKCVYIHVIRLVRYRRKMLMWDLSNVIYFKVTCKNKLFIFKAVYLWERNKTGSLYEPSISKADLFMRLPSPPKTK